MLYRVAHAVNTWYPLTVAWLYIAAFVLGFSMLFVFPQITLLLLFVGLASLGVTIMLGWAIDGMTRRIARRAIRIGRCPRCGSVVASAADADEPWECPNCGSQFGSGGDEIDQSQSARREHQ